MERAISGQVGRLATKNAVIAAAGTTSAAVNIAPLTLVGITFPAAFTGTTVTFTVCDTADGTFVPLYNSAGAVSFTIAQARHYALDPVNFRGIQFLKVVSGSAEGAERTLILRLKGE